MPFPLKPSLQLSDIITESIILLSALIFFISIWKLHSFYGKKRWVVAKLGAGIYLVGSALDLLDEFYKLPQVIPRVIENSFIAVGISFFSVGLLIIVRQLINMAQTDPLTGLYNKRYLEEILNKEIGRSKRYGLEMSVIFLDIDGFKGINDTMGHLAGDDVLRRVALVLKKTIRLGDTLARFGGDEFVIVMPHTNLDGGLKLLYRLKKVISELELPGGYKIGISGGVAHFPDDGDNVKDLINVAGKRMYEDKIL